MIIIIIIIFKYYFESIILNIVTTSHLWYSNNLFSSFTLSLTSGFPISNCFNLKYYLRYIPQVSFLFKPMQGKKYETPLGLRYICSIFQDGSTNVEEAYIDFAASAEHFPSIWQVLTIIWQDSSNYLGNSSLASFNPDSPRTQVRRFGTQ